jgi:hypothetical protein
MQKSNLFKAYGMLVTDFWDVMPCSLIGGYQCFERTYHLHLQGSTTWHQNRQLHCCENLQFHLWGCLLQCVTTPVR